MISAYTVVYISGLYSNLTNQFQDKGGSRETRTENVSTFFHKLPKLIIHRPFGVSPNASTNDSLSNEYYIGTNFSLSSIFQNGGLCSLMGYLFLLFTSISSMLKITSGEIDSRLSLTIRISFLVSFSYIIQRKWILDTFIYGFLFLPYVYETTINDANKVRNKTLNFTKSLIYN